MEKKLIIIKIKIDNFPSEEQLIVSIHEFNSFNS
jgi:hypothetical protein